jgi:hypothetical protein
MQLIYDILELLKKLFEDKVPRKGEEDKAWYDGFERFLRALTERRKSRYIIFVNQRDYAKKPALPKKSYNQFVLTCKHRSQFSVHD